MFDLFKTPKLKEYTFFVPINLQFETPYCGVEKNINASWLLYKIIISFLFTLKNNPLYNPPDFNALLDTFVVFRIAY